MYLSPSTQQQDHPYCMHPTHYGNFPSPHYLYPFALQCWRVPGWGLPYCLCALPTILSHNWGWSCSTGVIYHIGYYGCGHCLGHTGLELVLPRLQTLRNAQCHHHHQHCSMGAPIHRPRILRKYTSTNTLQRENQH